MIVVDVLLGLNLVVLGLCALRGQTNRHGRVLPVEAETARRGAVPRGSAAAGEAVILPFRPRRPQPNAARAMALHPSAGHGAPNHR